MKVLLDRKLSIVFLAIQLLASIGIVGLIIYIDVLPVKYLLLFILLVLFLMAYGLFSQISEKTYIIGRILISVFCILFVAAGYYGFETISTLQEISAEQVKIDTVSYLVLKDDAATKLEDTKGYQYGVLESIDRENTDQAVANAKEVIGQEIPMVQQADMDSMVQALYSSAVQVIVFNESFRAGVLENYPTFSEDTKVIGTYKIKTDIPVEKEVVDNQDITKNSFNIYISGIDVYGDIDQTSRSDVNIVATINPETKQILLTSAPRDFYVPMANSNGIPDKLTHAGECGVDNSRTTLEML